MSDILEGRGLCLWQISTDGSDLEMQALGLWSESEVERGLHVLWRALL